MIAIAVPRLSGFRDSADTAKRQANERTIDSAVSMYIAREGSGAYTAVDLSEFFEDGVTLYDIPGDDDFDITNVDIDADGNWSAGS